MTIDAMRQPDEALSSLSKPSSFWKRALLVGALGLGTFSTSPWRCAPRKRPPHVVFRELCSDTSGILGGFPGMLLMSAFFGALVWCGLTLPPPHAHSVLHLGTLGLLALPGFMLGVPLVMSLLLFLLITFWYVLVRGLRYCSSAIARSVCPVELDYLQMRNEARYSEFLNLMDDRNRRPRFPDPDAFHKGW